MKRFVFLLIFIAYNIFGQQVAPISQFSLDPYFYNPAAAGSNNNLEAAIAYRKQWLGLDNAPTTYFASAHQAIHVSEINSLFGKRYLKGHVQNKNMFVKKKSNRYVLKHAAGITVGADQAGAFRRTRLGGSYALHLPFENFSFALGATIGYGNFKFDPTKVTLLEQSDATYDSYLAQGSSSSFLNIRTGIYLYSDHFSIGYAVEQLLSDQLKLGDNVYGLSLNTHNYIVAGGIIDIDESFEVKPNTLLEIVSGLPINWHINTLVNYQKSYELGLGLRRGDAVTFQAGYIYMQQFKLSYAYDVNFSPLKHYNGGSHELIFMLKL